MLYAILCYFAGRRRGPNRQSLEKAVINELNKRIKNTPSSLAESKEHVESIFDMIGIPAADIFDCDSNNFCEYAELEFLKKEVYEKEFECVVEPTSSHNYKDGKDGTSGIKKPGRPKNTKKTEIISL